MKEKVIKLLLDRPIAVNPVLVKLCGLNGGYVLSQAIYWEKTMGREFYKTQVDWQNELNISRHELATGVRKATKYLRVVRKGVPAQNYYHIDWVILLQDLGNLDVRFTDNKIARKRTASGMESGQHTYTETTTDNNAENNNSGLVNSLIEKMVVVDPKNKNYYRNKTQREACNFLINEYGFEQVRDVIQAIPVLKSQNMPYMPSITTPCELRDKWVKLLDRVNAERNKNDELRQRVSML